MNPDGICKEYSARPIKLNARDLGAVILIEGTQEALEFFGKLILAQSVAKDDGFEIGPDGPGNHFFGATAEKGLYIHRLEAVD